MRIAQSCMAHDGLRPRVWERKVWEQISKILCPTMGPQRPIEIEIEICLRTPHSIRRGLDWAWTAVWLGSRVGEERFQETTKQLLLTEETQSRMNDGLQTPTHTAACLTHDLTQVSKLINLRVDQDGPSARASRGRQLKAVAVVVRGNVWRAPERFG